MSSARSALAAGPAPSDNPFRAALAAAGLGNGEETSPESSGSTMPGALEAAEGGAPEVVTHNAKAPSSSDEMSVEEEAISGIERESGGTSDRNEVADDDSETAALAEGRAEPPASHREGSM